MIHPRWEKIETAPGDADRKPILAWNGRTQACVIAVPHADHRSWWIVGPEGEPICLFRGAVAFTPLGPSPDASEYADK